MSMRSVNKVILLGNLGKDAETNFTPSGISVSKFSVATSRRWKDKQTDEWKEETDWTNVVVWRQEALSAYLTKGKQVYIEGRLQTRSYENKEGKKVYATEVIADEVILLGGKEGGESARPASKPAPAAANRTGARSGGAAVEDEGFGGMGISDDDVPF